MGNKPWKVHERRSATLIAGKRHTANQGGPVDVESEHLVAQCKLVQSMSLSELTAHALAIEAEGQRRGKSALLMVKLRSGKGVETPTLVIVTGDTWKRLFPTMEVPTCPSAESSVPAVTSRDTLMK